MKENAVKKLLAPVINTEYEWEGIIGSPVSSEYRNKMEFSFGDEVKMSDQPSVYIRETVCMI